MSIIKRIYLNHIKSLAIRFKFHHIIKNIYWWLIINRNKILQANVAGTTAQFNISNRLEYLRHQNLGGEKPVLTDMLLELNSDDIVYDVGANVGTFTCFLAKRLNPDQVVAFEPHHLNLDSLRSNLELNNTDAIIVRKALSSKNGTAELSIESEEAGEGKHSLAGSNGADTIEINLATGDRLISEGSIPHPTVIKIDVEGAEYRVLEGLRGVFERGNCRLCYIEVHPDRVSKYDATVEDIENFFKSHEYKIIKIQERGSEYFIKAIRC